ncbi:hypothetical protein [Phormidium sp. FACHB-1136]|uniref:hypothetical protein n=1 Tax=Phormidium sp. FACHB-1136 TaxID=2692848 RepID=UPI0016881DAC|nr:hypothetical protein [Phormidium sp. FACHB-1136]MBD2426451.1 hypothetical protein [Phormidium sp. FACHB-1136]
MEAEDRSLLQSIIKQVDSIASSINSMISDDQTLSLNLATLDSIDRECGKLTRKYLSLMSQYVKKFEQQSFSGFTGEKVKESAKQGLKYVEYAELAVKSVFVQFTSASLRLLIPGNQLRVERILQQLNTELDEWNQLQKEFFPVFQDKVVNDTNSYLPIDAISSLFGGGRPLAEARSQILNGAVAKRDEAMDLYRDLQASIQVKVKEINQPTSYLGSSKALLVDLDDNYQVTQVLEYQGV